MVKTEFSNNVLISGWVENEPKFSHHLYGEAFYYFDVSVPRLSGAVDLLPITVSERLFYERMPIKGDFVVLDGQLRSYNKHTETGNKLVLTVFARNFAMVNQMEGEFKHDPKNEIAIEGYICKPIIYRKTPFDREIADLLVAVNRSYNKSDYLPCIAWGRNARFAQSLSVGTKILLRGRIQSRTYQKEVEDGTVVNKTAYEVSCSSIEVLVKPVPKENLFEDEINAYENNMNLNMNDNFNPGYRMQYGMEHRFDEDSNSDNTL